jgi:hypothetical protein
MALLHVFRFSPVTSFHQCYMLVFIFNTTLIRGTGRRSLETIKQISVLSDLIKNWREKILILNDVLCFLFYFMNLQQNVYIKES